MSHADQLIEIATELAMDALAAARRAVTRAVGVFRPTVGALVKRQEVRAVGLSVKRVEKLLRAGVPGRHTDGDVKGLMLCVESKTSAHWLLRWAA